MDVLWPDLGRRAASNNLRQTLYAARRAFDPAVGFRYLVSEDEQLVLCSHGHLWVDVDAFEEASVTARRSGDPAAHRAAIELYAGELLPADRYEEWAEGRRAELRRTFLSLLVALAQLYEEHGQFGPAAEVLRGVMVEEPTREEAHVGLMRLYALEGSKGEALAQYGRLEEVLSRELDAGPAVPSRALREEIAAGRFPPRGAPSPGSLPAQLTVVGEHNLPASRTSFVGRQREMTEVKRELVMTRLLTLTGPGGSGKTRLALEVSRDLVGAYPDGVWLVELAGLSEESLVPQAVAEALRLKEQSGQPLIDTLAEALRSKDTLLVLDNCEHLVDAVARLVDVLLDSCPGLKILATSREALGLAGQTNWVVPSLSVPESRHSPTVEQLEGYESARLFIERASHRRPDFALGSTNAQAMAEICRRLEGVPLAIELAAARVGVLSVEQISKRLADMLKLLTGGSRTETPRQRTLRGTLDWSYDLLDEPERKLFRWLSVFAGGWTLEAAESVTSGDGVEEGDILDVLSGLADKSLVAAETTGEGEVRYRMLEPVRQYAREKLEKSGEAEAAGRRHAAFFLALAEESEPGLWGPEEGTWLERLEAEHDNLRAALSWTISLEEPELAVRLAGALRWFWELHGHFDEGREWLEQALAKGGKASAAARAKALDMVGWLAWVQGDMDRAEAAAEEGLKLNAQAAVEVGVAADLLRMLASVAEVRGDYGRAMELYDESLRLCRETGDGRGISWSLSYLGDVSRHRGDYGRAKELYEEGLALSRELGDTAMIPWYLLDLAYMFLLQDDHDRAAALNEEVTALFRERDNKYGLVLALRNLGWEALLGGDTEQAKASYEESLALCREFGYKITGSASLMSSANLEGLACIAETKGETERAARLFGVAHALREALGYQQTPEEHVLRGPYLAATRSRLGETSWKAAFAEGQAMTTEVAVEYALAGEEPTPPAASIALTRREKEVASLVARGLTNRQIASELVLSAHTVRHHVTSILKKLNLRSREQVSSHSLDR
jgi:non-specific serine/threonine protein kinase